MPKRFRKKTFKKKRTSLTKKVAKLSRMVRMESPEVKYIDLNSSSTFSNGGNVTDLTALIIQGIQETQHIASKIRLLNFNMWYRIISNPLNTSPSQAWRFDLVKGIGENTAPINTTILYQVTSSSNQPLVAYNHDTHSKYKVLSHKKGIVATGNGVSTQPGYPNDTMHHCFKKLNFTTDYQGTTASVINHGLYVFFVSDATVNFPTVNAYLRILYTDA